MLILERLLNGQKEFSGKEVLVSRFTDLLCNMYILSTFIAERDNLSNLLKDWRNNLTRARN